jgi:signal transduction histidine kinase
LAVSRSPESRTLLFRHLCDLFLHKRLPAAAADRETLYQILRLLRPKVGLSLRRDLAAQLYSMDSPPEPLVRLLIEDVDEVCGPLIEHAALSPALMVDIARTGSLAARSRLLRRRDLPEDVKSLLEGEKFSPEPMPAKVSAKLTPAAEPVKADAKAEPAMVEIAVEPPAAAVPSPSFQDLDLAAAAIRRNRGRLQDFVRTAADWQWETDRSGRLTYVSDGATVAFGQPPALLVGAALPELLKPANDEPGRNALEEVLGRWRPFADLKVESRAQGSAVNLWRLAAVPVFDIGNGRFQGYRGAAVLAGPPAAARPSPPVGRRQPAIAPATNSAASTAIDPSVLAAVQNLSHELRTPLNAILGFSEMIAQGSLGAVDPHYRDYANRIVAAGQTVNRMISDILEYAPLVSGKSALKTRSVGVAQALRVAMAATESAAAAKPVLARLADEAVPAIIACDPTYLEACLANILGAAIAESAPHSTLTVTIHSLPNGAVEVRAPIARPDAADDAPSPMYDLRLAFAREIARRLHYAVFTRPAGAPPREIVLTTRTIE